MSIDLSPEHQDFVRKEVESGHFANEQELIGEAIELLRTRQGVLNNLQIGIEQLNRGEGTEYGRDDRQRFVADIVGRTSAASEPS